MALYLHPTTQKAVEAARRHVPHGILLHGREGVGLKSLAVHCFGGTAATLLEVLPEKNEKIDLDKGTITVDSIRRLYDAVKTLDTKGRIVLIDYAERMGAPAQNAFLKLLEEPPKNTQFILLSHAPELLLPTIVSRVQSIDVRPISLEQSHQLLDELAVTDATKRAQLLFIGKGLPAQLSRLVADEDYFVRRAAVVKDARLFVTGSPYERLLIAKKYKDDRRQALVLLDDACQQVKATLVQSGQVRMLRTLDLLERAHKRVTEQGNIRLQLSSLIVL